MISARLVQLIEANGQQIIDRTVLQIRREPEMVRTQSLLDHELREWGHDLLRNLGHWLSAGNVKDLAQRYERMGKLCWEQEIPLHEALRAVSVLREKMLDFAEEHIISNSSIELYAEEELARRLGRFFDVLMIHMVKGFENALHRSSTVRTATH